MAVYLRISAQRAAGERLLDARPFGRRSMWEAGLRAERGKGPRIGINLKVSARGFEDFRGQLRDAVRFLRRHRDAIRRVLGTPGVRSAVLDFGVEDLIDGGRGPAAAMCFTFPKNLTALAGEAGLSLELSIYPSDRYVTKYLARPKRRSAGRAAAR